MSKHNGLFNTIIDLEKKDENYAIATVFMVNGSSSGKVGDKVLYDKNGNRIIGYIGGGCIENRVAATVKEAIIDGEPKIVNINLDSDEMGMGIPCGGYMSIIIEPQLVLPTILIRGTGNVVEVLSELAHTLKFKVVIQTPEEEADRFPYAEIITNHLEIDDIDFKLDYFVLATHHRDDDKISLQALKKKIPYVAVLASRKKTQIITDYLRNHGISEKDMENFHAPAGLDLEAKSPEEIALSIISEIVMHRNGGTGHPLRSIKSIELSKEKS
ncbi:MAG: XshC-Cox1-family protein [Candidatus Marinimicrobia bacterium]|nr:XshC-Cox1-family protein [Candidatus Neomarinimicrobiota bacterium]|tara:strand:+ start:32147 stop:32959 length:813 start_codon:yes stop_codon:yes gene_type:complete